MVDASYSAVAQGDDDTRAGGASTASPASVSHATSSPSAFLSLSDYAFTPLSMVGSDFTAESEDDFNFKPDPENNYDADAKPGFLATKSTSPSSGTGTADMGRIIAVTRPGMLRRTTAGRGASSIVGTLAQSLEHLHATSTAPGNGYEPVATKNICRDNYPPSPATSSRNSSSEESDPFTAEYRDGDQESRESIVAPQSNSASHRNDLQATTGAPLSATSTTDVNVDPLISNSQLTVPAQPNIPSLNSTTLVRPKPRPLPPIPQPLSRSTSVRIISTPNGTRQQPELCGLADTSTVAICHPLPNINTQSGACLGNIATLEATAEQFTSASSIEDAIRQAHDELKRSDSRRSSILHTNSEQDESDNGVTTLHTQIAVLSRQSSILGTNSTARLGGYSPGGYVMSPNHSMSNASTRFRSISKTSSLGVPTSAGNMETIDLSDASNGERFPSFLSRHGPGKSSVRSVVSSKLSLVDIAETEPPMTLTLEALDEADRAEEAGDDSEDEDTIRASAHQQVEDDHVQEAEADDQETPQTEALRPMLDHDFLNFAPTGPLQLHQHDAYDQYRDHEPQQLRPPSAASGATSDNVRNAFGDFDGVHCDPDTANFPEAPEPEFPPPLQQRMSRPLASLPPRPKSYFDMQTGQQMLFYPARVPAMLNLPPKLSKSSKKPMDRQKVRSQVLSVIPQESRDSRIWLPDPLAGLGAADAPLMSGAIDGNPPPAEPSPARASFVEESDPAMSQSGSVPARPQLEAETATPPETQGHTIRRPQRLTDSDKRKSHAPVGGSELPPQLRASVFFDLPEESPKIVVKDHSAMATLDSILDASASAPVSAFTDHAFAGKLGSEIYGPEKKNKRKSKMDPTADHKRSASSVALLQSHEPKKRASFLSLLGHNRKSSENLGAERRRTTLGVEEGMMSPSAQGSSKEGQSPNVDEGPFSPNLMAPDSDEEPDKEEDQEETDEEDDEDVDNLYQGRPTTLLAELQIRKQRNKMRTRPAHRVYPNGLHSTLLELDTVAEVERSMRKGKKVNLAWEDPSANPDLVEEEDDEEVPLAMLAAARAAAAAKGVNKSTLDIGVVMDEVNRPLGLMERRELEENEPLSRRRDRIQGRAPRETLNLETMQKRMTQLSLAHGGAGLRSQSRLALPLHSPRPGSAGNAPSEKSAEPEVEGETLAERRKRLQGDTLPRARPVSGAFSSELLSQFGGDDEKDDKRKGQAPPSGEPEEEETLGQRRRRLQAEREAREREMGAGRANLDGDGDHRLSRRMSMADILTAHPLDTPQGAVNPREQQRLRLEAEAVRARHDKEAKMAAMRAQMPQNLVPPSVGGYNGGYMGGQFNDGLGGGLGSGKGLGYGRPTGALQRTSTLPVGYGGSVPLQTGYAPAMTLTGVDGPYGMGAGFPGFGGMPATQGQLDMIERWRQSIRPGL